MAITKITTPEVLDFPKDSTSSANTSGTVLPTGYSTVVSGGGAQLEDSLTLAISTTYTVTVGTGGSGASGTAPGDGLDSTLSGTFIGSPITSKGGGASGTTGGSGGGAFADTPTTIGTGETNEGYDGGDGFARVSADEAGGGGGGGGGVGGAASSGTGGAGGIGIISFIKDAAGTKLAGGGGGGARTTGGLAVAGYGGGDGSATASTGGAGTNEKGGGGGSSGGNAAGTGGDGGDGIIIIRYPSTISATLTTATGTVDNTISGSTDLYAEITAGTGTIEFSGSPSSFTADYLVLAGGGAGGQDERGGGGAGGIRTSYGHELTQRPATADAGEFRYNEQLGYVEYYNGSTWLQIADEYITGQPSTCICNFPITATALYELNSGVGSNVPDTCGSYDGTATNITYSTGEYGNAAVFNGSSSDIILPTSIDSALGNNNFSYSFWIYGPMTSTDQIWISLCQNYFIYIGYLTSQFYINLYSDIFSTGITISAYTWTHIAFVKSSSTGVEVYKDGVIAYTSTTAGAKANLGTAGNGQVNVIGRYSGTGYDFNGSLDQLRFFPSTLTSGEVLDLSNEVICT